MKKMIFTLGLILSFSARAEIITGDPCGNDCSWTFDTDTGKLTISGSGDMYDYLSRKDEKNIIRTLAPWRNYDNSITKITIEEGITSVGKIAFYHLTALESVSLPETLTKIGQHAFQYSSLVEINLPDALTDIGHAAFNRTNIEYLIIPENYRKVETQDGEEWFNTHLFGSYDLKGLVIKGNADIDKSMLYNDGYNISQNLKIYCENSNMNCQSLLNDEQVADKLVSYDKQGGVYILEDGTKFLSAADMAGGTNICDKELNECKRDVLEAKGLCQGSSCDVFIQSDGQYMLKFGGKTYQDINALLKGDYDKRRIYTIEEANFVAGDKNRVSITYR